MASTGPGCLEAVTFKKHLFLWCSVVPPLRLYVLTRAMCHELLCHTSTRAEGLWDKLSTNHPC